MKIAVPKERRAHEKRVAATPGSIKKLIDLGFDVTVETGAGEGSSFPDAAYRDAGADIADSGGAAIKGADIVLKVRRPLTGDEDGPDETGDYAKGQILVGMLAPYEDPPVTELLAKAGLTGFTMELIPRITRAQSMDVLSSQSNLAGYRAVIDAAFEYGRAMPMMMTAAGTIAPAKVFVLGAGVAGLQAVATAKRLGGVVSATDVRPAVKEQVESLGASFVMVESDEADEAETAGGYAKEMSEDYQRRQAELIAEHLKKQDIVITTAQIPGKPAPTLVSEEMVSTMKPGAVLIDLAVESGGNCPLSKPGEIVEHGGVKIVGHINVPSRLAADASELYAKNLVNFLTPLVDQESGELAIDWEDEIVAGTALTRDGQVIHPNFKEGS